VGDAQVVLLHSAKEESLSRKLDRLTNVQLVIRAEPGLEIYPFLEPHVTPATPVFDITEINHIRDWLSTRLEGAIPPLKGLILAGGKSQRMGRDKAQISYHGVPQLQYLQELMQTHCSEVLVSRRPDQEASDQDMVLEDMFAGLGPYGGILSAFRKDPDSAWLVVAVDLPLVDKKTLSALVSRRDPSRIATAFHNPATDFPEPLITIWEPKAYPVLLNFLSQGYSCPRKVLINSDVHEVDPADPGWLRNVNTPQDLEEVRLKV
jgi:molybdopterin-guanine dinucleotide biosynthesis protein A